MKTMNSRRGMVVTPHHLASEAGLAILREGGNAVEAAVAAASTLSVVYPHMTGLGGDNFWSIYCPAEGRVRCIDACGRAGEAVTPGFVKKALESVESGAGGAELPRRGPMAATTLAGAVSGWEKALELASGWGKALPLERLLEEAIWHAEHGFTVSRSQSDLIRANFGELAAMPEFAGQFLENGNVPEAGSLQKLPALARTLRRLGAEGLEAFYRGRLGREISAELAKAGAPLSQNDFTRHRALETEALSARVNGAKLYNCPPPSQGVASLLILGIYDAVCAKRARASGKKQSHLYADGFELVHLLVEATKQAFAVRDRHLADPEVMAALPEKPEAWLRPEAMAALVASIRLGKASGWQSGAGDGDTVWLGVVDAEGRAVSCIQSIYFEFGSGLVLPECGLTWHNRGLGFSLDAMHPNCIGPGKKPFHTLNPALALFDDGRVMPYGTMGGEGQPQTQAALFSRYAWLGYDLQEAISAPRWLLGRAWGDSSTSLKLESDFDKAVVKKLLRAGHELELVPPQNSLMGHAGAIVRHADGRLQGASDPRSDGLAACW